MECGCPRFGTNVRGAIEIWELSETNRILPVLLAQSCSLPLEDKFSPDVAIFQGDEGFFE